MKKAKGSTVQSAKRINNITVHNNGGTVNINLGKCAAAHDSPVVLDKRSDGFSLPTDASELTEDEPPGPPDMGGSTVYGNMCKASNSFNICWIGVPHVAFKQDSIVFNHAAIRKFGLRHSMAIMICVTPDESAIRFYLGQERFPNSNAVNKYGYYKLHIASGGNKHKQQIDPRTGDVWANPEWMTGRLQQNNKRSNASDNHGTGSRRDFPLMTMFPSLVGGMGQLQLDRRFYRTRPGGRLAYNVLYTRMSAVRAVPENMIDKTIGLFSDVVDSRLAWATTANNK